jgi:rhodanese-related sulfurtransferase
MKKIKYLFSIVLAIVFLACQPSETVSQDNTNERIQTQEGIALSLNNKDWVGKMEEKPGPIIDVRTEGEYKEGHIENGKLVDISSSEFSSNISSLNLDKSKAVYVYCRSGNRSKKAMSILKEMGFTEIYELDRGVLGWEREGNSLVK